MWMKRTAVHIRCLRYDTVDYPQIEQVRYPLLLTMAFGAWVGPDRLLEFAQAHRAAHEERLARYRALRDDPALDGYARATVAFGVRYEEAVLDWMAELPAILPPSRR
jgi:hypothetical protein